MIVFAIDPGPVQSGWVLYGDEDVEPGLDRVRDCGVDDNQDMLRWVQHGQGAGMLAIETMQANYGIVGDSVISTLVWIGRFKQAWRDPEQVLLISRQRVKAAICNGNAKAADSGVRTALIERIGVPGTKKAPGPTYGVTSHAWSALAVAVTAQLREIA